MTSSIVKALHTLENEIGLDLSPYYNVQINTNSSTGRLYVALQGRWTQKLEERLTGQSPTKWDWQPQTGAFILHWTLEDTDVKVTLTSLK